MTSKGNRQLKLNYQELKENGFLQQVQPDQFALRIKVVAGQFTADNLQTVSAIASKYGQGTVHFTSRQAVEIPFIQAEDIEAVKKILQDNGLSPGVLGSRVRTITACQGSDICKHGNINTTKLAQKLTEATEDVELPHKFKIGVTGCSNNCLKAEENDLGIKGAVAPKWSEEKCNYCGLCALKCPAQAIDVKRSESSLAYDDVKCINCGKCVQVCSFKAWSGRKGYQLYFGGTFGRRILIGQKLTPPVFTVAAVLKLVQKTLRFYQENGQEGERFGYLLARVGTTGLQAALKGEK